MDKKIVILNGSPRKTGNTSALIKSFKEGAENSGNTVKEFFLDNMNIHGCKGCFSGNSKRECPCVQKDDMALIYPAIKECDVVVLASPLYYWTMSGQLRTALDRLFALEEGDSNLLRGNGNLLFFLWQQKVMDLRMLFFTMTILLTICVGKTLVTCWQVETWKLVISKERLKSKRHIHLENLFNKYM